MLRMSRGRISSCVEGWSVRRSLLVLFLLLFCLLQVGCRRQVPPNVLVLVIDSLRRDHLGVYGYERNCSPNLDRLAKASTIFTAAVAQSPYTRPSVASLFTSLYPHQHQIVRPDQVLSQEAETMAELFSESGYSTGGIVENPGLKRKFGFDQGFDSWNVHSRPAQTPRLVADWLSQQDRPFLLYVHLLDPHSPYEASTEHQIFCKGTREQGIKPIGSTQEVHDLEAFIATYDEEIHFVDEQVQRILESLERSGKSKETVVVVMSDHGEGFLERGYLYHSYSLNYELVNIPLLIRWRGLPVERRNELVSLVDIMPTLLDIAGIPYFAENLMGRSLMDDSRPRRASVLLEQPRKNLYFDPQAAVLAPPWKLIHTPSSSKLELYNINTDPSELKNLADSEPQIVQRLRKELNQRLAERTELTLPPGKTELRKNEKKVLRSLGYID